MKVDAIKDDTSSILRLSKENRAELRKTRDVLLKAAFEATEVTTPTTFVVLKKIEKATGTATGGCNCAIT